MTYREVCEAAEGVLSAGQSFDVPRPLADPVWTDEAGTSWRRRGVDLLSTSRARRLLNQPETLVMHVWGGPVHQHSGKDRDELVGAIEAFWAGAADPMIEFQFGEFRRDGSVLLMVVESC